MIDPSIRLRRAVLLGDVVLVQRIIQTHPKLLRNPDFEDKANTSLHLAATHGHVKIATLLIAAGHEKNDISWNAEHETPLMLAAKQGHVEVGTLLIKAFPRCVLFVNKNGLDALALSCQNQASTPLVSTLLSLTDFPASPQSRDMQGNTPLHHASASGSLKALRILLAAGANPLAKNNHDWTPLAFSATVAGEVYFRNLVAEFERKKVEGAKAGEERERQRAAGLRMIESEHDPEQIGIAVSEDEVVPDDGLRIHRSPETRRRPTTPAFSSLGRHEWGSPT
ncbi:hypothetical protein AMS68_004013 [Peltaster fructicola]|uniref:Uncharacterized protein n=1 Tax=Peltaster fructicola TaxID=286661 RepID=A0A6H0XUY7_9PEZI|nr:hypothetical protein AMS68_004013 [Peltaster fructicola]